MSPQEYSFLRYLSAKKSVDDRALNHHVWQVLAHRLPGGTHARPLQVLEIGAGIGTMVERMLDWGLLSYAHYTAIDTQPENISHAHQRLVGWADKKGFKVEMSTPDSLTFDLGESSYSRCITLNLEAIDLFDFAARQQGKQQWDLLVAHAFLDLMDIPATLPLLFNLLRRGGLFYFTINFDSATLLEPELDPRLDGLIQTLYHRTMDERITAGHLSGDSRAGRHLFTHLKAAGAQILAAGASDWVVFAGPDGYLGDEAYFLHFIIDTIHQALNNHPQLDKFRFEEWINQRHAQVERHELVYIAHQLDFAGVFE